MEQAIAYIRVSDQRQADEGSSLSTQEKQVIAFAVSQKYEIKKIFKEEGESAKTDLRPCLQEMLQYCKQNRGKFSVLIFPKIDRLARKSHDYSNLKLELGHLGIRLESVGERIDDSPVGRLTESLMASIAQFDNEVRAERCKGGMLEAVSQGRWVWKAPMGYQNIRFNGKGTIEPKQPEAELVQRAFSMLASGNFGLDHIRRWLEQSGLRVSRPMMYKLLTNPIYIGQIRAFGQVFEASSPFIPLVSNEMFVKAGSAMRHRSKPIQYRRNRADFPLRGTIRCKCGHFMTSYWATGKTAKFAYYRCMQCKRANHPRKRVEEEFLCELNHYKLPSGVWDRISGAIVRIHQQGKDLQVNSRESGQAKITKLLDLQKAIALKNATGVIPDDIAKAHILDMSKQIEEITVSLPEESHIQDPTQVLQFGKMLLDNLGNIWSQLPLQKQKDFLRFMFPKGVLYVDREGFRTLEYPLLEQFKGIPNDSNSSLVDPNVEISNSLITWLVHLDQCIDAKSVISSWTDPSISHVESEQGWLV